MSMDNNISMEMFLRIITLYKQYVQSTTGNWSDFGPLFYCFKSSECSHIEKENYL